MSTSKPRSANEVATTLAPRSWPSCPILAIIILGLLPFSLANLSDSSFANLKLLLLSISNLYIPDIIWLFALYLPNTFSQAVDISPNVALCCAAITASSRRFPLLLLHACVIFLIANLTFFSSLFSLISLIRFICSFLTFLLFISKRSNSLSLSFTEWEFKPIIKSFLLSILACFLAAACSIFILGIPFSIAFSIPPSSSISCICSHALWHKSWVSFSK